MSGVSVVSLVITLLGMAGTCFGKQSRKEKRFLARIIVAVGGSLIRFYRCRSLLLIYLGAVFAGIGGVLSDPLPTAFRPTTRCICNIKPANEPKPPSHPCHSFCLQSRPRRCRAILDICWRQQDLLEAAQQPQSVEGGIIFCSIMLPLILCAAAGLVLGPCTSWKKKSMK